MIFWWGSGVLREEEFQGLACGLRGELYRWGGESEAIRISKVLGL